AYASYAVNHWMWSGNSEVAGTGPVNFMVPTTSRPIRKATFTLRRLMKENAFRSSSTSDTNPRKWIAGAALTVVCLTIATLIATVAVAQAPHAPQPPEPKIPPTLVPSPVLDLMTAEGMVAFAGRRKTTEAKIVESPALP